MKETVSIPIFLSSDNNYVPYVATTIASICSNTKTFCEFYILDGGISEEYKEKIYELKNQFNNFSIEFIRLDYKKYLKDIKYNNECKHITISTYNRFFICELKPEIKKAIYLDADIIVLDDIEKLFNENLEPFYIGAVKDQGNNDLIEPSKIALKIKKDSIYFNAGVLLINLEKWKEFNCTKKLLQIENDYRTVLRMADQDILNKYFENNYKLLDDKYNVLFDNNEILIRHFWGPIKPWHADFYLVNKKPYKIKNVEDFWKYAQMTDFYEIIKQYKENFLNSNILYKRLNKIVLEKN